MQKITARMTWILVFAVCCLGLTGSSTATVSEDSVDLMIELKAPQHVAPGSEYVVNLSYENLGTGESGPETWVDVHLPTGVEFVSAKNQSGVDMPPNEWDESFLSWIVGSLPADSCCRHIFITLQVISQEEYGTALVVEAEIGSDDEDTNLLNNQASVTSLLCEMANSSKQVNAPEVMPGDVLIYTIQLRLTVRSGVQEQQERFVQLTDTPQFTHQVRFLGWLGSDQGTWDGNTLRWQGRVRTGETRTLQYRFGVEGDVPPGTVLRNYATIEWDGQSLQLGPVESVVTMAQNAWMVGPLGYVWQHANGFGVEVPPGAVTEPTRFEFRLMYTNGPPDFIPTGYVFAYRAMELNAFRFGPINEFEKPIIIRIDVDPNLVNQYGRERLRIWYRNQVGEAWMWMTQPDWLDEDTLVFTTDHLTQFALFAASTYSLHLPVIWR